MWTPEPSEQLAAEIEAALARPGASHVRPPRPVAHTQREKTAGWLWGRLRTDTGWLGLATLYEGRFFEGAELHWYPAEDLRTLD